MSCTTGSTSRYRGTEVHSVIVAVLEIYRCIFEVRRFRVVSSIRRLLASSTESLFAPDFLISESPLDFVGRLLLLLRALAVLYHTHCFDTILQYR